MSITRTDEQDIGVDPFGQCITLPSACHYVYRRNFMKPKAIGLIPSYGYHYEQTSYKAIKWLKYIMGTHKIYIQHAKNGTEKIILNYKVFGWCEQTSAVYELNGCFFTDVQSVFNPKLSMS
jgi:hypothetical protein